MLIVLLSLESLSISVEFCRRTLEDCPRMSLTDKSVPASPIHEMVRIVSFVRKVWLFCSLL